MSKAWIIFVIVIVGCTAPVKQEVLTVASEKSALDGIWVGSFDINSLGPYDFHAIHVGERSTAVSNKAKAMYVGQVMHEDYYYAKYNLYALDGAPFDYARITGTLKDGQIESHFTTLNGGDTGRLILSYDDLYEQPSALELLEGDWSFTDRDGLVLEFSIQNGAIKGADSDECKYIGDISLINPQYNAYDVVLHISNCDSVNGKYEGLSYVDNKDVTYYRIDVGNMLYGFHYDLQKEL